MTTPLTTLYLTVDIIASIFVCVHRCIYAWMHVLLVKIQDKLSSRSSCNLSQLTRLPNTHNSAYPTKSFVVVLDVQPSTYSTSSFTWCNSGHMAVVVTRRSGCLLYLACLFLLLFL
ncbi:hypothetical protein J3Q64DRAFT_1724540 [Phycomyces blakesleeanus]|uniref:Uncharacterized protein n=1 Tax=Phycomyces blakesleeanus TaxID=4837 RepID=A0ABR3B6L1_PHYBL